MARYPGMMRRGTKWYLRVRVPDDVRDVLGQKEIWKSLRTGDYQTAKARFLEERTCLERQFMAAREGKRILPEVEARRLVNAWFEEHDRQNADADFASLGPGAVRAAMDDVGRFEAILLNGDDAQVLPHVQAVADATLIADGWPSERQGNGPVTRQVPVADVDKGCPGYWVLVDGLRRAMLEAVRRRQARLAGEPLGTGFDPAFANVRRAPSNGASVPDVTLAELVDRFLDDPTRDAGKKANHDYMVILRLLGEFVDANVPARAVTREHCRSVARLLKRMPANTSRKKEFRGLGPLAAAAKAERLGVPPMQPATANSYISKMSALFRWAVTEGIVDRNPAEKLLLPDAVHKRDARAPFSIEQLNAILAADVYHEPRDRWDHRQWVFLLALFGGLRMNEACTLRCDDVHERDGVPVVSVVPDPDGVKKLKTRAARRVVPVHPTLVDAGFLEFVKRQRRAGHDVLFPNLKPDRRGYYSDAFQKWFARQLAAVGAAAPRTTFHSTRHNFRDALREGGVGRDAVLALGGWSSGGTEEVYGGGLRPRTLAKELAKVGYPGLDLSGLATPR